jgi:3-methyladenine DNA glycosylase AlkC
MLAQMRRWADHPDEQVRRLASEGSRPLLPWGRALPVLRDDPTLALPILEALREDPSAFVRRSVANHLNDLSKNHPALVRSMATRWLRDAPATRPLVKHGCRTLLKRGDAEVLALFGCDVGVAARVVRFALTPRRLCRGETVTLTVEVEAEGDPPPRLRIDFAVAYCTPSGGVSRKQFRLAERVVDGRAVFTRRLSTRDLSTRTHAPGRHLVRILLNGREAAVGAFVLA